MGTGVPAQLTRLPASLLIRSSTPARGMCPGQQAAAGDMDTVQCVLGTLRTLGHWSWLETKFHNHREGPTRASLMTVPV